MSSQLKNLYDGGEVSSPIYKSTSFSALKSDSSALYTFLYYIGYLTVADDADSALKIPNREIRGWYLDIIENAGMVADSQNPVDNGNPAHKGNEEDNGRFSCILE